MWEVCVRQSISALGAFAIINVNMPTDWPAQHLLLPFKKRGSGMKILAYQALLRWSAEKGARMLSSSSCWRRRERGLFCYWHLTGRVGRFGPEGRQQRRVRVRVRLLLSFSLSFAEPAPLSIYYCLTIFSLVLAFLNNRGCDSPCLAKRRLTIEGWGAPCPAMIKFVS